VQVRVVAGELSPNQDARRAHLRLRASATAIAAAKIASADAAPLPSPTPQSRQPSTWLAHLPMLVQAALAPQSSSVWQSEVHLLVVSLQY
jgi:hypothetical protein